MSEGIWARGVGYAVAGRWLARDISLEVGPGQALALVGPNGAGKSTLLKLLSGLLEPSAGQVWCAGRSASALAARRAVVLQAPPAVFDFTALELVLMGMPGASRWRLASAAERRQALACLERVELGAQASQAAGTLSGGELQRVLLARALASGAAWWFLDEPLAGLDLKHQALALALVRERCEAGGAVVAVMHELGAVERGFEQVALLRGGSLVACGAPGEVLTAARLGEVFEAEVVRREVWGV
jgi:iron complex transport system ATP-binding protein